MPPLVEQFLPIIGVFAVIMILLALIKVFSAQKKSGKIQYPYQAIPRLFTPAERSFLGVLEQSLDPEYRVFGKVRVADVLEVKKGVSRSDWQRAFNRISSKHFDFVVCRADNTSIVLLIELDDKSHNNPKQQDNDRFLDLATKAAAVPLLRVPCRKNYSTSEISSLIASHLPK